MADFVCTIELSYTDNLAYEIILKFCHKFSTAQNFLNTLSYQVLSRFGCHLIQDLEQSELVCFGMIYFKSYPHDISMFFFNAFDRMR